MLHDPYQRNIHGHQSAYIVSKCFLGYRLSKLICMVARPAYMQYLASSPCTQWSHMSSAPVLVQDHNITQILDLVCQKQSMLFFFFFFFSTNCYATCKVAALCISCWQDWWWLCYQGGRLWSGWGHIQFRVLQTGQVWRQCQAAFQVDGSGELAGRSVFREEWCGMQAAYTSLCSHAEGKCVVTKKIKI